MEKEEVKQIERTSNVAADASTVSIAPTSLMSQLKLLVAKLWSEYDYDDDEPLDKIETANFLNAALSRPEISSFLIETPTLEQFNQFFREFDVANKGVIEKHEIASFTYSFII